ncbi:MULTISPECIES: hypothetical protein [unclassified Bacteroides]|jgi:hypothetical protein|uniref:hypothetical protein n=1 Tax=unclassified Bacteroides TaxID=2646097 RepID=UPI000E928889|nr:MULTISPECIES: hypothetical protein [unclassified Bacteroides]RGN43837.1 hypothetical protein DXB63_15380 [Bacteroides sp. OM05-12]RHR73814.1 hypothetical protein DWW69_14215 [Bacteroides sp. AF16-49]DAO79076.1 MAG TPA: tail protein [Phycodnaviridae sp.]
MTIIIKPGDLNLSGNLDRFRISSAEKVAFRLRLGNEYLLSQTYDPNPEGIIEIDVKDVVESRLSSVFRDTTEIYTQTTLVHTFVAEINGTEETFRVVRGGVDQLQDPADNFLRFNFLTWQPQTKKVTYYQPEYLTYYAVDDVKVKVKAYFQTLGVTTSVTIDYATLAAGNAYTIPMQYGVIAGKLSHKLPSFYDVWIETTAGARLTYIQRYVVSNTLSEQEQWIIFENSLGGLDTFRAYGATDFSGEHTHNIAEIDDVSYDYRIDTERKFKKNTGYLDKYERQWLLDFFPAAKKFIYTGNTTRSIVVLEDEVNYNSRELPSSYTFTYKYADARPLLNLPRTETLPDVLDIEIPDLGSFTIPPRLIEFPHLPLSEGVMFPAQNPYSEDWGIVTAGGLTNFVRERLAVLDDGTGGVGHSHVNFDLLQLLSYVDKYLLVNKEKIKAGLSDRATVADELKSENFSSGAFGSGMRFYTKDGITYGEIDQLLVRMKAIFHEIVIEKLSHVGGEIVLSPARMVCIKVEGLEDAYRCYFKSTDGDKTITNDFVVGDQARCQTFNIKTGAHQNVSNRFYWRLVTGVGDDYIDLSITDCLEGSDIPAAGDEIVQLGNRYPEHEDRQNAVVLSSYGPDAPSSKQYMYIDSYSLEGKDCEVTSPHGNKYVGDFFLKTGDDLTTEFQVLKNLIKTEIQNIEYVINNEDNYLSNASFTADLDNWVAGSEVSVFNDSTQFLALNSTLYAVNESFSGLASYNGKYMLRIRNSFIKQLNENIKKISKKSVFYISFKYICKEEGKLTCGFVDQRLYSVTDLATTRTPKMFEFSGIWDGSGDFLIQFTGDIYISLVSLTNRPLDEFKEETRSSIEQTNELIKTEIAKVTKNLENYSTIEQTSEHIKSEVSSFQQGIENLVQNSECTTSDVGSWVGNPYVKGCTNMTVPKTVEIGLDRSTKLLDTNYYLSFKFINNNLSAYIYLSGDSKMNYKCLTLSFDYFITSLYPRNATLDTAFGVTVESDGMLYGSIFSKPLSVIMGTWAHASFTLDYRDNDSITINNAMLLRCNAETATILVRNISLREVYCDLPYSPSTIDLATKSIVEQTAKSWSAKILNGQDNIIAAINMDRSGTHMLGVVSFESFTADFKEAYLQAFGNASMTAKDDVARQLGFSNYQQLAENAATQGKAVLIGGYLNLELIDVKTLLAGDIISEMISSNGINIAGKFFFNKDSKALTLGNLKVLESGALAGGNAIFDDIGKFSMWPSGTSFENLNFESFIIDRIDKMTTIVLAPCEAGLINVDKTFDVYLPDKKDLFDKNIDISYGFRLTIIASGKLLSNLGETSTSLIRYKIKCRSDERYGIPVPEYGLSPISSKTYIRDNDYKVIDSIGMAQGDVLELYFCYGDYYFVNRSN